MNRLSPFLQLPALHLHKYTMNILLEPNSHLHCMLVPMTTRQCEIEAESLETIDPLTEVVSRDCDYSTSVVPFGKSVYQSFLARTSRYIHQSGSLWGAYN